MLHFLLREQERIKKLPGDWQEKSQGPRNNSKEKVKGVANRMGKRQKIRSSSLECQELTTCQLPAQGKWEHFYSISKQGERESKEKENVILTITEQKFLFQLAVLTVITTSQLPTFQSKLNGAFCNTQGNFLSRSHYSFIERHLCTLPQSNLLTNIRNSRDGAMGDSQIKYSLISFRWLYCTEQPKGFRVNLPLMACGTWAGPWVVQTLWILLLGLPRPRVTSEAPPLLPSLHMVGTTNCG